MTNWVMIKPQDVERKLGLGVKAAEGLAPSHPTLGDVDSREALDAYQEKKRAYKAKMRAQQS